MIRYLILGFLNHDAVAKHEFVLRKPLDLKVLQKIIKDVADIETNSTIKIDGMPVLLHDGYLTCPAPVMRPIVIDFIKLLVDETGCDIVDIELGQILSPQLLRDHYEVMMRNQAPSPFGER